jgi:guanosine-3',5'-bis(diphosphate) 3'-pyrophosphohydrolase
MADSLNKIKRMGKEIACVKMADRITNLQQPPDYWKKEKNQKNWAEKYFF